MATVGFRDVATPFLTTTNFCFARNQKVDY